MNSWYSKGLRLTEVQVRPYPPMNMTLPSTPEEEPSTVLHFLNALTSALSNRTHTIPYTHSHLYANISAFSPRLAVLFSGGLDCTVLAWIIHTLLPLNESIDLVNVAFENPRTMATQNIHPEDVYSRCPDRITGRAGWEELRKLSQDTGRNWRFVEVQLCCGVLKVD